MGVAWGGLQNEAGVQKEPGVHNEDAAAARRYWQRAQQLRSIANGADDPSVRLALLRVAGDYEGLALTRLRMDKLAHAARMKKRPSDEKRSPSVYLSNCSPNAADKARAIPDAMLEWVSHCTGTAPVFTKELDEAPAGCGKTVAGRVRS